MNEIKAKSVSLWCGKVLPSLIIIGGLILKGFGKLPGVEVEDIIKCALAIAALFTSVDVNIALDKFTKKAKGNEDND